MEAERAIALASTVTFVTLALLAARIHLRHRTASSRWLLLSFATIGAAVVVGELVQDRSDALERIGGAASGMLLLAFPYALFRFGASFHPPPRWMRRAAAVAAALVIVALPFIPLEEDEPTTPLGAAYLVVIALYWTTLSVAFIARLWRSSLGQPSVIRNRLRVLAGAAAVLNVALLLAAATPAGGVVLLTQLLGVLSAVMFLLGFAPPAPVRRSWRHADEIALRRAERGLLAAEDVDTVVRELMPQLAEVFGGEAALVDVDGRLLGTPGAVPPQGAIPRVVPGAVTSIPGALVLGLEHGSLVVSATAYTPFFGQEEVGLLQAFAGSVDLALSRVALLARERSARERAEAANAELEALLYGISHDLRTPLVALTGYVEMLTDEGTTSEDAPHVLTRIAANTSYMDALITGLLDLSRIGRTQESSAAVDLTHLAKDLAAEIAFTAPAARLDVRELPVVHMEPTRARQLLTNIVGNALRHSGRPDVTITLTAVRDASGATVSIADDGVGIEREHRQQVFGIFERLQARDGQGGGTGIGLAMCRKILEQIGGSVWIADASSGTDVRFHIPADKLQDSPSSEGGSRPHEDDRRRREDTR